MSDIVVLQHAACEHLGAIGASLAGSGLEYEYRRIFAGDPVPDEPAAYAGIIVMGGPMGVYDDATYPFLREELALLDRALRNETPVLGICLGSQLLAAALGATVGPGRGKEIGWHLVEPTEAGAQSGLTRRDDAGFVAFHWHGDIFECPPGARNLATSVMTPCQAFSFGEHTYGLLFHMEITREMIGEWVEAFAVELCHEGLDGGEIVAGADTHLQELQERGEGFFTTWAWPVAARRRAGAILPEEGAGAGK